MRGPGDDPSLSDEELIAQRAAWFQTYTSLKNVFAPPRGRAHDRSHDEHAAVHKRQCDGPGWRPYRWQAAQSVGSSVPQRTLANTGVNAGCLLLFAILLLGAGGAALILTRRRRASK